MNKLTKSLNNLRLLDDLAGRKTSIHSLHPLAKLLVTIVYLITVVSFGKYDIAGILPLVFFPVILVAVAELPGIQIFKRMLLALPFVIGIGIFNPLLDQKTFAMILGVPISYGWISFLAILIKCGLTVAAVIILIATTGMTGLAYALRILKVPRLFVLQLVLTFRYISVLIEEASNILLAYSLRAPLQKGVKYGEWGSLAGNLLLRSFDRAQRIHEAMDCRGFTGEYHTSAARGFNTGDYMYLSICVLFFLTARFINLPETLGHLLVWR